jgi:diguanylate cyclase (GGDEF)-like protein
LRGGFGPTIPTMAPHESLSGPGDLRVLVVEDDPTLGHLIRMVLQQFTSQVQLAATAAQAIEMANEGFDCVACDISLPDASGLAVIEELRSTTPAAGIVAVTGMVDVEVAVQSMKAGADDFLAKPFDPEILWHVLNKAIDNRKQRIEASQTDAYRKLAYTDALTGCPNRRYIDEFLDQAVTHARATGEPLCVGYTDIDNFKLLNDFVGHEQGDVVLRGLARALDAVVQPPDVFARFGGDEFVVVFPGANETHANLVFDRLRARVDTIEIANEHRITLPTRVSCGVAAFTGEQTPRDLVAAAEDRMYLDKSISSAAFAPFKQANSRAETMVKVSNLKALRSLVKAIDRRDSYTRFHSDHATNLAVGVARDLGLDDDEINGLMIGGPIHDLGKIVVPDEILRKPGRLTTEERRQMEEHPVVGAAITAAVTDYETVVNLVRHHHERFDGEGYPGRLKGENIPLTTRLFAIADAVSAMTTDRPYRKGLTTEQAIEEVRQGAGTQFDADLAAVFVQSLERQLMEPNVRAA